MIQVFGHPLASFYWKVAIALYEREVPFEFLMVDGEHPENAERIRKLSPTGQFPVLLDGGRAIVESAAIIEYLDLHHGNGSPMVPPNPATAIEARQMDGIFDDYVQVPLTRMVLNTIRAADQRDPLAESEARSVLDRSYAWLDRWMQGREWAANNAFGVADCSAAPALFYAHWGYPIPRSYEALHGYRKRLNARPSVKRVIDEGRPWRDYFPLKDNGDPD